MIKGKTKEQQYRAIERDSSSSLKIFSQDRKKYYKLYILGEKLSDEEDSKASITGRIVETLLYEPELFDKRFYMSAIFSTPTGNMLAFVEALCKHTLANTDEDGNISLEFEDLANLAYKDSGFKWTFERVVTNFTGSDAEIYYKEIREVRSKGFTIVTLNEVESAQRIVEELKNCEHTSKIVNLQTSSRYEVLKQCQIENYEIDGIMLKSMLDQVVIDHKEKTITPYDLKCTWSVENFYDDYYLYRRAYIQAYLYKEAVKKLKEELELENYTINNIEFIVCDSINYYIPLIYKATTIDMNEAYNGFNYKGRTYPGVKDIIADLKWAKENDNWRISKTNYNNDGIVKLKP